MPRPPEHKALVDALVDGEVQASEVAKRASELGVDAATQFKTVTARVMRARAEGKLSPSKARDMLLEVWFDLSLAAFARVAQDVLDAAQAFEEVKRISDNMGPEKLKVSPIRNADILAREQEKRGVEIEPEEGT